RLEHPLEARDDEQEEDRHDGDADPHERDRVDEGARDLVADLHLPLGELGDALEHVAEAAGALAGADEAADDGVERAGVAVEGLAERLPAFDPLADVADDGAPGVVLGLALDGGERVRKGGARADEDLGVLGEVERAAGAVVAPVLGVPGRGGAGALPGRRLDGGGEDAAGAQGLARRGGVVGLQRAGGGAAGAVVAAVGELHAASLTGSVGWGGRSWAAAGVPASSSSSSVWVTRRTSSRLVRPALASRTPSRRRVAMPSARILARSSRGGSRR